MKTNKENLKEQDLINQKLKSLYNSIQEEVIPDKFLQMLEQLDAAEQAAKNEHSGPGNNE